MKPIKVPKPIIKKKQGTGIKQAFNKLIAEDLKIPHLKLK